MRSPTSKTPFQTKQALVYNSLRDDIMQVRLKPGDRLIIEDIAGRLGVSPIPVREALQLLQSEHLVEQRPHVGAVVSQLSPEDAREIFALMEALETAVFAAAAAHASDEDIAGLRSLSKRMRAPQSDEKWLESNIRFHRAFATIARMPRALAMLDRISGEWGRLRRHHFSGAGQPDAAVANREHDEMIDALAKRDVVRLEKLVREHNRSALAFYLPS